jgi:arylformamidase
MHTFPLDISVTTSNQTPVWPGHQRVNISQTATHENGDVAEITHIDMGAHTATHLDAPRHFVPGGSLVDALDLSTLIGPCHVHHVTCTGVLTAEYFASQNLPDACTRLLLKIDDHAGKLYQPEFYEDYTAIDHTAATYLINRGLKLIGIDYLSIGPYHAGNVETHQALLGNDVIIVEGLDLSHVDAGPYELVCLPIRIACDGAPCRAVLMPAISPS